ncbi:aggregation-promoting factor C-terminal-like domain-containing protein [Amnibacterium kyonggiense]
MRATAAMPGGRRRRATTSPMRRRRRVLSVLAVLVCTGIALVSVTDPYAGATAATFYRQPVLAKHEAVQRFRIEGGYVLVTMKRDRFTAEVVGADGAAAAAVPSGPVAPASVAQAYAAGVVASRGWAAGEFGCLVGLWNRESGWNSRAANPSGAYGIPQALPGSKMGAGWQSDYRVQIRWGVGYIAARYGSPCGALAHSNAVGSY